MRGPLEPRRLGRWRRGGRHGRGWMESSFWKFVVLSVEEWLLTFKYFLLVSKGLSRLMNAKHRPVSVDIDTQSQSATRATRLHYGIYNVPHKHVGLQPYID